MNTTLTALELNSNNIDYDGATALAEAITENTSLSTLHLRCGDCKPYPHAHLNVVLTCALNSRAPASSRLLWNQAYRMKNVKAMEDLRFLHNFNPEN